MGFVKIIVTKYQKMVEDALETSKNLGKVPQCRKKGPLVLSGVVCYAKKNNYHSSVPGPNGTIWPLKILFNRVEIFWSVRVN